MQVTTIGLDIAKHVFQVHGADAAGKPMLRQRVRRGQVLDVFRALPPCTVGIEACATAHHWARELQALGHQVRLVPPSYVKAYVKRGKNDAADAEAICEAVIRPTMRFVPVKAREQQAVLMLHRARSLVIAQRRSLGNAIRAHLAEFGIVGPQGRAGLRHLLEGVLDPASTELPDLAREVISELGLQLTEAEAREAAIEAKILAWHRANEVSRRLATIPGIGPITASAIAATAPDPTQFTSGRHFAAWVGLVPRQHSTGGKERLGPISKRGDGYLRRLLLTGSQAVLRWMRARPANQTPWLTHMLGRRPWNVVATALANKTARIAWAVMARGETYRKSSAAPA
jgi:transposase